MLERIDPPFRKLEAMRLSLFGVAVGALLVPGLAGAQVGAAVAPEEVIQRLERVRRCPARSLSSSATHRERYVG